MTREERVTIDPADLIGIVLVCGRSDCGAEITVSVDADRSPWTPYECPHCGADWRQRHSSQPDRVRDLFGTLRATADHNQREGVPYRVRLQIIPEGPEG